MKKAWLLAVLPLVCFFARPAQASTITFGAFLNGPSESPPNASLGIGTALVTIDDVANTMRVQVDFSGLVTTGTGTTASHIHCCTPAPFTGTAGVATTTPTFPGFPLGVRSGTYDQTFNLLASSTYNPAFIAANGGTVASAEATFLAGMFAGETYLNVHSSTFGGGEIRGFLQTVPEPTTISLLGLGLGGLVRMARRRGKLHPPRLACGTGRVTLERVWPGPWSCTRSYRTACGVAVVSCSVVLFISLMTK
jgi:hypothetical protein